MKVKLLQITNEPITLMWIAARTCYSEKGPIQLVFEEFNKILTDKTYNGIDDQWKLVQNILKSGHYSIAEHVSLSFAIEGISRACSHQLVRHRLCVYSQQSQRYVKIKEEDAKISQAYQDMTLENIQSVIEFLNQYFVGVTKNNCYFYLCCLDHYIQQINNGEKAEDARQCLPNATKTNLVMTCNLRQLIHMCNLRLCTRAQKEIRELFTNISKEVIQEEPRFKSLLVPNCEIDGYCKEFKSCGRKPSIKTPDSV